MAETLVKVWDNLINILKISFANLTNLSNNERMKNLNITQKTSLILFGYKNSLTSLRQKNIRYGTKNFQKLIKIEKLNDFYTRIFNFENQINNKDKKKICKAFKALYKVRFPNESKSPKITKPRLHSIKEIHDRKTNLLKLINDQFEKYYPDKIELIDGINIIQSKIGASKITIITWIKEFLKNKYVEKHSLIYDEIWFSKSSKSKKIKYERIKSYVERKKGKILTGEQEFNNKSEYPSERYVKIKDKKGHVWTICVTYLINDNNWCPICHEFKTENSLRSVMRAVFKCNFPPKTLRKAINIPVQKGGNLKYDGFNNNVVLQEKSFKIAFEYDGLQHDCYPNSFHRSITQFEKQKKNDLKKNSLSKKNNVLLIRIKAINGFKYRTRNNFEKEIKRQFFIHTSIKLPYKNIFSNKKNHITASNGLLDKFLTL